MEARVQLMIQDAESNRYLVDLYGEDTISMNYSFSAIETLADQTEYSHPFTIPATDNNAKIFGYQNLTNDFASNGLTKNIRKKFFAYIAVNTIPLLEGFVQFKSATIKNGSIGDFQIVFYGRNSSLMTALADLELKDLDYSAADVVMNLTNMAQHNDGDFNHIVSWQLVDKGQAFRRYGFDGVGKIVDYPLNTIVGTTSGWIMADSSVMTPQDLTPFVSVEWIVQLINEQLLQNQRRIVLDSSIISHIREKLYIPFSNSKETKKGQNQYSGMSASITAPYTISWSLSSGLYRASIPTLTESYDSDGAFDPITKKYVVVDYGTYLFKFRLFIESSIGASLGAPASEITPRIKVVSPTLGTTTYYNALNVADTAQASMGISDTQTLMSVNTAPFSPFVFGSNGANASEGIFLLPLDEVTIELVSTSNPSANGSVQNVNVLQFNMVQVQNVGQSVNLAANAPQYKLTDFVRDLMMIHNAVMIPDYSGFDTMDLIPIKEYLSTGDILDWSDQLHDEDNIIITPSSEYQMRRQKFSWSEGADAASQAYKSAGRTFGYLELYDTQSDFTQGERAISLTACSTPNQLLWGDQQWTIPKFINNEYQYLIPGPRMLYINRDFENNLAIRDAFADSVWSSVYTGFFKQYFAVNHVGQYYEPIPNFNTLDLNFGQEIPLHPINQTAFNTLFYRYYSEYLAEVYSPESKVMEASFMLNVSDIINLQYNASIFIKDSYWRILEINDYTLGENQVTRCKLIRKLDSVNIPESCQLIPVSVTALGKIVWNDMDGNVVTGTELCCSKLGYFWDSVSNSCNISIKDPKESSSGKPISTHAIDGLINITSNTTLVKDPAAVATLLAGKDIKVLKSAPYTAGFGENVDIYKSGIWYGGGADAMNNRAAWGVMVFKMSGIFNAALDRLDFDAFKIPPSSVFTARVTITGTQLSSGLPINTWTFMGHGVYASNAVGVLSVQDPLDQILSTCDAGGDWLAGFDMGATGEAILFVQSLSGLTYPSASDYYFTATIEVNQIGTI
jgi:hypothetical protein